MGDVTPMPSAIGPTSEELILSQDEWSLLAHMRGVSERRLRRQAQTAASMSLTERELAAVLSMRRAPALPPLDLSATNGPEQTAAAKKPLWQRIGKFLEENDPTKSGNLFF
ncbi:hypothetical protein [Psychromicrobium xiongbiense]|uniref:hypothetical protein n=1 Tax=Psychromicrobium xiongbiense TaxID=3051184 RepID=UPI00255212A1|nr:hypothetical protein [Psychromicrobium sp. YIM S02556]